MAATDPLNKDLEVVTAPIRSLDDFLLSSARFQVPQFSDPSKWSNRITANLLYYQTNYFIVMGVLFLILSLFNPRDMIIGFVSVGVSLVIIFYFLSKHPPVLAFKRDHQLVSVAAAILAGFLLISTIGSAVVFLFALAFPLMITFLHASLRLRNFKNKIANKAEAAGMRKTVMGQVLDVLGMKPDLMRLE